MFSEFTLSRKNISLIRGTVRNLCLMPQRQTGKCMTTIGPVSQHVAKSNPSPSKPCRSAAKWPSILCCQHQFAICKHGIAYRQNQIKQYPEQIGTRLWSLKIDAVTACCWDCYDYRYESGPRPIRTGTAHDARVKICKQWLTERQGLWLA